MNTFLAVCAGTLVAMTALLIFTICAGCDHRGEGE